VYRHPRIPERLNIQPDGNGKAKAYQVKQLLDLIDAYHLQLEDES